MTIDFPPASTLIERAVNLARALQERAAECQTSSERRQQAELDRMLQTPADKATLVQLTDQAFRSKTAARVAEQFTHILDVQGIPRFFSPFERALLRGFQTFGGWLPGVSVPLVKEHMQHETANVVIPAEPEVLTSHLRARRGDGVRMNVNFLGEALLGEAEAQRRIARYTAALRMPEIECLSVKISTMYSQISAMAREHTVRVLCDRLEPLYREAAALRYTLADGTEVPKFIYLDMEEYRDMRLTAEVFRRTLDRQGMRNVHAGIALQAYLPDSARVLRELQDWARERVASGGSPVTVRLVKGANLEMERVEAGLRGWPQAPFKSKLETDANYKRMLYSALQPSNLAGVRVGIASHNLFDVAFGLVAAEAAGAGDRVQFEMLEGMANHQRRALFEQTRHLLLYAPACRKEEFLNAIGYLIRRLDENTGPDNFLRHAFRLRTDSDEWKTLEAGFREAFHIGLSDAPRRTQSRSHPLAARPRPEMPWRQFVNEPDTDFALPQNSAWAQGIVGEPWPGPATVPMVVDGETVFENRRLVDCLDPSRPGEIIARFAQANSSDIARAVECAEQDRDGWRSLAPGERSRTLGVVAQELRNARATLIRAALANGGKTITESDPEVSEAVDFVEFYRNVAGYFYDLPGVSAQPKGAAVVVSPWNFPIAIPCGGVAAALAAGNCVILKPSSDAALIAWELCQCFWRGGVSRRALQFLPCSGAEAGRWLVSRPEVGAVILTGGTETALTMLENSPAMPLYAETGGKNATIVTALSDREQAIKHVLHSVFSHSGQKCSATSLLLLEAEVYDDPDFKETFRDAAESMLVGSAWDLETRMGPLIRPPSGALAAALTSLEPGESWALEPRPIEGNPNLWSPGVKWGVQPGSVTHLTEFFGPLLGVMRFTRLDEAIGWVNQTGYGLTSGLESLDDREQELWMDGIRAGNLYINKPTTGAIVLRQPFGGMGKSSFGPGMKAGGPNYVAQFMRFADSEPSVLDEPVANPRLEDLRRRLLAVEMPADPGEVRRVLAAISSYDSSFREEFGRKHDHFRLLGEDNFRRYLPLGQVRVRVLRDDSFFEVFARACAAQAAGCRAIISSLPGDAPWTAHLLEDATASWAGGIEFVTESDDQLMEAIRSGHAERIRFAAPERAPMAVRSAAHRAGAQIVDATVVAEGRIELLWYVREQSVSHAYHRYGNLGARAGERRAEPL